MIDILSVSREAFTIFGYDIYWYGIILTTGMIAGFTLALIRAKKAGFTSDYIYELFIITIITAIIGARLFYVVFNDGYFPINDFDDFKNLFDIRSGGITIIGGVAVGFLGVLIAARRNKVSLMKTTDLVVPSLLIGQVIGRWGNFVNQEAYGQAVENTALHKFPFSVFIERNGTWHYATFFYESLLNFIAFVVILIITWRKKIKTGTITFAYLMWYGIVRAIMEITRTDAVIKDWGPLGMVNITQLFCILIAIGALIVIILIERGKITFNSSVMSAVSELSNSGNDGNNDTKAYNQPTDDKQGLGDMRNNDKGNNSAIYKDSSVMSAVSELSNSGNDGNNDTKAYNQPTDDKQGLGDMRNNDKGNNSAIYKDSSTSLDNEADCDKNNEDIR